MKLLNFTIIKLCLCLALGILIASFVTLPFNFILFVSVGLLLLLLISLIISKNEIEKSIWFGLFAFLTALSIGALTVQLHDQKQFSSHYSKLIAMEDNSQKTITLRVREVLKPTPYQFKYVVDILKYGEENVTGRVVLNVQKDTLLKPMHVDDIVSTNSSFQVISTSLNPHQFDYKRYLEKQYIYHQISTTQPMLFKISSKTHTLFGVADRLRAHINTKLRTYHFKSNELAIINALLLGQRKDIDKDIYDNYSKAGVIHILAVSGLHVGIIFIFLSHIFKPVERLKHGKIIKSVLIVLLLISFAIIAGLSASVTRAVAMFCIVAIAMNLKRPTNIYNTLAISMFFLLLFKPNFLFDVGFQMSYMAVFAIVSIQPLLAKLWIPKYKLVNYFWQIFTVTIAAQIGVVPISLFYFHQFPGLFFVSNLIVIPGLGFILGFGILVIIMALLNILPSFIADLFGNVISWLNAFIAWIAQKESFVLTDISIGLTLVILSYLLITSGLLYLKRPKYSRLCLFLICIMAIQAQFIYNKISKQPNELVIFHKSKSSLIGIKSKKKILISSNLDSVALSSDIIIRNYKLANGITAIELNDMQSVYAVNTESLVVIDSLGVYNVKTFTPDYILLRNSPKINLIRMIDSIRPKLVIADGSNYKSYINRWKATCQKQNIPFHQTSEKGAFIFKY